MARRRLDRIGYGSAKFYGVLALFFALIGGMVFFAIRDGADLPTWLLMLGVSALFGAVPAYLLFRRPPKFGETERQLRIRNHRGTVLIYLLLTTAFGLIAAGALVLGEWLPGILSGVFGLLFAVAAVASVSGSIDMIGVQLDEPEADPDAEVAASADRNPRRHRRRGTVHSG